MDPAPTLEIKGVTYQIGKLNVKKAFHVSRRLAPFLGVILPYLDKLLNGSMESRYAEVLPAVAKIVADMPNEDVDYIIDTCLAVVSVRQDRGWAPIQQNGVLMFDNIDMMDMLHLTAEVVQRNLADFFPMSLHPESAGTPMRTQ